jgi:hypothetical protein
MSRGTAALKRVLGGDIIKTGIPKASTPHSADQANPSSPVPCRTGKTRVKIFS